MNTPVDPVLARRAQVERLARAGRRLGAALFFVAIVVFFVGAVTEFGATIVTVVVACLAVGSLVLAPSIVAGYGVKAAAREDRARAGG